MQNNKRAAEDEIQKAAEDDAGRQMEALCREILDGCISPDGLAAFRRILDDAIAAADDPGLARAERERCRAALHALADILREASVPREGDGGVADSSKLAG